MCGKLQTVQRHLCVNAYLLLAGLRVSEYSCGMGGLTWIGDGGILLLLMGNTSENRNEN